MRSRQLATIALWGALAAGCFSPVDEEPAVPDAGGCPAGMDCGGGLLPDAGCPIGQVCPACDAGLTLVNGACVGTVGPGDDAGAPDAGSDAGPIDAGSPDAGPPDAGPPGPDCLFGTLADGESMSPIAGAAVIGVDLNGIPIPGATTTSGVDGSFQLCPPLGLEFTAQITAVGYPVTYFESVVLVASEDLGSVPMISNTVISALGAFISGFVSTDAAILVPVRTLTGGCSVAGWSVAASFPEGGSLPDGGALPYQIIYLATSGLPSASLTSTSTSGLAVLYNIDPTLTGQVAVTASSAGSASCLPDNALLGLTGEVEVGGGAISLAPVVLP